MRQGRFWLLSKVRRKSGEICPVIDLGVDSHHRELGQLVVLNILQTKVFKMIAIELVRAIFFGVVLSATIGNSEAMTVEGVRNFEKEMEKLSLRRQKRHPEHLAADYPTWVRVGECPITLDGHHQYYCPTPSPDGRWVCLDDYQLCDGIRNCPNAEDECLHWCLFYKSLKSEVSLLSRSMAALFKREQLMEEDVVVLHAKVDQVRQEDESASRHHRQNGRFVPVE